MGAERGSPPLSVFDRFPILKEIPQERFPQTVLIIPDGNGRFAAINHLPISEGHKLGAHALKKALELFVELPIKTLLVWGFSNDNWKRPQEEINGIMRVMDAMLLDNVGFLKKHQVRLIRMGREDAIQTRYPDLWATMTLLEEATKHYPKKILGLLVDFSGQDQELRMIQKAKTLPNIPITHELIDFLLRDGEGFIKPADLVIRTSGEQRMSDIGWLGRNAEFCAIDALLPYVVEQDFVKALVDYSKRERRFGGRPTHSS